MCSVRTVPRPSATREALLASGHPSTRHRPRGPLANDNGPALLRATALAVVWRLAMGAGCIAVIALAAVAASPGT